MVSMMRSVRFANAGNIPIEQSASNALTQWANDMERKLLGLHCGQMLDRQRHCEWAANALKSYDMTDRSVGYAHA